MGRTLHNHNDQDDDRKSKTKFAKHAKHTKNIPGSGMRVINRWSEESEPAEDLDYDSFNLDDDGDYDDDTAKYFAKS